MGMDGIGGVGALNVSSQTRVTRPQSETVPPDSSRYRLQAYRRSVEKATAITIVNRDSSRIAVRCRRIRKLHRTRSRQRSMI